MRALWAGAGLAIAAYALCRVAGLDALAVVVKPVPVAVLALLVLRDGKGPGARVRAGALAVDAVADFAIELSFLAGLAVFLVGHVGRIVAFTLDRRALAPWRALPFLALVVGVGGVVVPTAGALGPPIALYAVAIGAMGWRAAARVGASPVAWLGLLGACVYLASDTLLAANRFLAPIPLAEVGVMATYWGAQALIASSALGALADPRTRAER